MVTEDEGLTTYCRPDQATLVAMEVPCSEENASTSMHQSQKVVNQIHVDQNPINVVKLTLSNLQRKIHLEIAEMKLEDKGVDYHDQIGARLSRFLDNWAKITQDPWILQVVRGYQLEFAKPPAIFS